MPRARDPNRDKAYEIYKEHDGTIDLVDIANQLNVPSGTVRGWKNKDKWDMQLNGTFQIDKERNKNVKNVSAEKIPRSVKNMIEDSELNEKQKLFCLYFSKSFNATRSYLKAYGGTYVNAMTSGSALLRNPKVKAEIERIKEERYTQAFLKEEDIFQKYMDIAFADITDFMMFNNETITIDDELTGKERDITISHVNVKNDYEVDGTIISEVSKGKDGVKIKLGDRMKALDWLTAHMNMATEEQKARIAAYKAKTIDTDNEDETGVVLIADVLPEEEEEKQ